MIKKLTLILILLTLLCSGQKTSGPASKNRTRGHQLFMELYFGNLIYSKNFYNQLNTIDNLNFNLPARQLGIGYTNYEYAINARNQLSHEMALIFFLPNKITIDDSIHSQISGFLYSFGLGKSFFKAAKYFRLNAYLGFNTGRTILTKQDNLNFKNPFFAPKLLIQPKLIIKKISISLLFSYAYDISNQNWLKMRNNNDLYPILQFKQSNYSLLFAVGRCLSCK